jgi:hypothetical protein
MKRPHICNQQSEETALSIEIAEIADLIMAYGYCHDPRETEINRAKAILLLRSLHLQGIKTGLREAVMISRDHFRN